MFVLYSGNIDTNSIHILYVHWGMGQILGSLNVGSQNPTLSEWGGGIKSEFQHKCHTFTPPPSNW